MSTIDPSFGEEIRSSLGGERAFYCFQCGICTGACPSARFAQKYNPRVLVLRSLLGKKEHAINGEDLWLCSNCCACEEFCPQEVRIYHVLTAIRNIAASQGNAPKSLVRDARLLADTGEIASRTGVNMLRKKVGLKPMDKPDATDVLKIMKKVGFYDLLR